MRRLWAAAWPWLGVAACAVALAFIPRDAWWWGLAAGALLGAANVIGWHEGRREVRAVQRQLATALDSVDALLDGIRQQGAELDQALADRNSLSAQVFVLRQKATGAEIDALRREVAALRRQNLALDAQLDHMTRVNQALDAGITTTSTQERT